MCCLQTTKEESTLSVFPRALSQTEQSKVLEACNLAAVVVDKDMSTSISLLGMTGRVRKVSPVLCMIRAAVSMLDVW